ncbi:penicillin-binding transpeptidase domain-containing protein [uncultured Tateyamaria sp.]|uniref:penicillin-binding transpeptidase domain-containing protein n=1 Tax=Tateyamaria sp. 1078 TaxID=3417464 RepID=UPI00261F220B|nr:penicillin-binding transpeptidase domain-containing protein [uncultured Tateyamaria sp.]
MAHLTAPQLMRRACLALCLAFPLAGASVADTVLDRAVFADQIGQRQSSFLARDLTTGAQCILADSDLETRHAPWSTFKIPNTLIALETGVAGGLEAWRDWDRARRPAAAYWPREWRQGQTLQSAFRRSALWYYQDIAIEVGAQTYRDILSNWDYGNADAPDGSDGFWLGGPLALSITEQVRFLERLLTGQLAVSDSALSGLIRAAETGRFGTQTLYGKTGAGRVQSVQYTAEFEGWYVGWLGSDDAARVVFAHHSKGPNFSAIRTFRQDFATVLLRACGYN